MANKSFKIDHINKNGTISDMIQTIDSNFDNIIQNGGGPAGKDGRDGADGADGVNIEYIYTLCDIVKKGKQYPADKTEFIDFFNSIISTGYKKYGNANWYSYPQSISKDHRNEYVFARLKLEKGWDYQDSPILWAHYGEDGADGDDIEYIYLRTKKELKNSELDNVFVKKENMDNSGQQITIFNINDFYPGVSWFNDKNKDLAKETLKKAGINLSSKDFNELWGKQFNLCVPGYNWTDEPTGPDEEFQYEYVSIRKIVVEGTTKVWSDYSTPALWSKYGKDGKQGDSIYRVYARYYDSWGTYVNASIEPDGSKIYFNDSEHSVDPTTFPQGTDATHSIEVMSEKIGENGTWSNPVIIAREFTDNEVKSKISSAIETALSNTNSDLVSFISSTAGAQVSATMGEYAKTSEVTSELSGYITSGAFETYKSAAANNVAMAETVVANATFKKDENGNLIYLSNLESSPYKSLIEYYNTFSSDSPYSPISETSKHSAFIAHCENTFATTFTEIAALSQAVSEKDSVTEIINAVSASDNTSGTSVVAAIFARANAEEGATIALNADKLDFIGHNISLTDNSSFNFVLSSSGLEISTSNFTLDSSGNVSVTGNIHANSLTIGDWDLATSEGAQGFVRNYQNNASGGGDYDDSWIKSAFSSTSISGGLVMTGNVLAATTSGSIVAGILGASSDSSDQIRFFAGTNSTTSDINVNASNASFRVTQGGKLYATNAEISGNIHAKSLTIGSWDLTKSEDADAFVQEHQSTASGGGDYDDSWLKSAFSSTAIDGGLVMTGNTFAVDASEKITAGMMGYNTSASDDVKFFAGTSIAISKKSDEIGNDVKSAPFRVTESGKLYATNAVISGTITAISGTIGGINITSNEIKSSDDNFSITSNGITLTDEYGNKSIITGEGIQMNGSYSVKTAYMYRPISLDDRGEDTINTNYDIYPITILGDIIKKFDIINFVKCCSVLGVPKRIEKSSSRLFEKYGKISNQVSINVCDNKDEVEFAQLIGRHITIMNGHPLTTKIENMLRRERKYIRGNSSKLVITINDKNGEDHGYRFYENGGCSRTLTLDYEAVELVGIGIKSTFYGFMILRRFNIGSPYEFGHDLKTLGMFKLIIPEDFNKENGKISIYNSSLCNGKHASVFIHNKYEGENIQFTVLTPFKTSQYGKIVADIIPENCSTTYSTQILSINGKLGIKISSKDIVNTEEKLQLMLYNFSNLNSIDTEPLEVPNLIDVMTYLPLHDDNEPEDNAEFTSLGQCGFFNSDDTSCDFGLLVDEERNRRIKIKIKIDDITKCIKCGIKNNKEEPNSNYFVFEPFEATDGPDEDNLYTYKVPNIGNELYIGSVCFNNEFYGGEEEAAALPEEGLYHADLTIYVSTTNKDSDIGEYKEYNIRINNKLIVTDNNDNSIIIDQKSGHELFSTMRYQNTFPDDINEIDERYILRPQDGKTCNIIDDII